MQNRNKKLIRNILIIGDSLSDRGVFYSTSRAGTKFISMLGLLSKSSFNRFSNGYVWCDHLAANLANKFIVKNLTKENTFSKTITREDKADAILAHRQPKKRVMKAEDISDGLISGDKHVRAAVNKYNLNDASHIRYDDKDFVRTYCEGALCNHAPGWKLGHPYINLSRSMVPYLKNKMADIKKDDIHREQKNKQETLVIVWSGANDIGLINDPFEKDYLEKVMLSIRSLEKHTTELIESGYRNFLFINLPNPLFTPRYNMLSTLPGADAFERYNKELVSLSIKLQKKYPHCRGDVLDLKAKMDEIVKNPEQYHFDKVKFKKAYLFSDDFKPVMKSGDPQPAPGYAYWDTVHPTTTMHAIIANAVEEMISSKYDIEPPKKSHSLPIFRSL